MHAVDIHVSIKQLIFSNIIAQPEWVVKPKDQEVSVDGSASFRCKATGMPQPKVEWFINGKPLKGRW